MPESEDLPHFQRAINLLVHLYLVRGRGTGRIGLPNQGPVANIH